ncbi:hypothetical protein [Mycoplasma sp. VS30B]
MKLKSILLTISGLTIASTPIMAISCNSKENPNETQPSTNDKTDNKNDNQGSQGTQGPQGGSNNNGNNHTNDKGHNGGDSNVVSPKDDVQLKANLDAKIQGLQHLDIKDKIKYTADQIKEMDKAELAKKIEVVDSGFENDKYGFTVVNVEKKLKDGSKYVINLEVQLFAKDKPKLLSETKKFNDIEGFNISKDDLMELLEQSKREAFIKGLSIQVDNKEHIKISELTKEQIKVISNADEAVQKLYTVDVESFRPKAVNTTLEATLTITVVKSGAKITVVKELEGFKDEKSVQTIDEILAASINDIKLSTKLDAAKKAPFPSLVKESDIIATGYNDEMLDFSVVEGSIKPKFEIIPPSQFLSFSAPQFKSSVSLKIKLTSKEDPSKSVEKDFVIDNLSTPDKRIYFAPIKSTLYEENATASDSDANKPKDTTTSDAITDKTSSANRPTKSLQLVARKNKQNYDVLIKYELEEIKKDDKNMYIKMKLMNLRSLIIDTLFEKSPDQTGKKIMLSTLTETIKQFTSRIIFTIDALYYSENPAEEYYDLFNGPSMVDKISNRKVPVNYLLNANYLIYMAQNLSKNGNV